MNMRKFCWTIVLTAIAVAAALLILRGWQRGGLALLQLPGMC